MGCNGRHELGHFLWNRKRVSWAYQRYPISKLKENRFLARVLNLHHYFIGADNRVSQLIALFDDMNDLFKGFAKAHAEQNGYLLAATLSPIASSGNPQRLRLIWNSSNSSSVKGDIKHFIKSNSSHQRSLDHEEVRGWVEVYAAYWNAIGDVVAVEDGKVV